MIIVIIIAGVFFAATMSAIFTPIIGVPLTIVLGRIIIEIFRPYLDK